MRRSHPPHPGRLYTFCGVNPRRPNALEILTTAVDQWGAIGLKLYSTNGFYPDDEKVVYPLYRFLQERDLPVRILFGSDMAGIEVSLTLKQWVDQFRMLPEWAKQLGYRIPNTRSTRSSEKTPAA